MLWDLKRRVEKKLENLAKILPLDPNLVTVFSIIAMLLAGLFVIEDYFVTAAALVFLSGFLDLFDGVEARAHNKATGFGSWFDRVADRVNDMIILSAILIQGSAGIFLPLIVLILIVLASYMSAVLDSITHTNIGSILSMRGIRIIVIVFMLLFNQIPLGMAVLFALACISIIERFYRAIDMLIRRSA